MQFPFLLTKNKKKLLKIKYILVSIIFTAFILGCESKIKVDKAPAAEAETPVTMESDADKFCNMMTKKNEYLKEAFDLSMSGDEDFRKKVTKIKETVDALKVDSALLKNKYNAEEFEAYLSDNCYVMKEMVE